MIVQFTCVRFKNLAKLNKVLEHLNLNVLFKKNNKFFCNKNAFV